MQFEKKEVNLAIARAMGEPELPRPADYVGNDT